MSAGGSENAHVDSVQRQETLHGWCLAVVVLVPYQSWCPYPGFLRRELPTPTNTEAVTEAEGETREREKEIGVVVRQAHSSAHSAKDRLTADVEGGDMNGFLDIIIALIVAGVTFWLLSYVFPAWIAALVAFGLFLTIVTGNLRLPGR